jgi:methionyl-tRNA synthetase
MEQVYNADLANSWGNLVSRSLNMSAKYFDGKTPSLPMAGRRRTTRCASNRRGHLRALRRAHGQASTTWAKDVVMELVHAANHYIEDSEPWAVAKDPARAGELAGIIVNLLESIRIARTCFEPFMPETSREVLRRHEPWRTRPMRRPRGSLPVGTPRKQGVPVTKGDALFPRLQQEVGAMQAPATRPRLARQALGHPTVLA